MVRDFSGSLSTPRTDPRRWKSWDKHLDDQEKLLRSHPLVLRASFTIEGQDEGVISLTGSAECLGGVRFEWREWFLGRRSRRILMVRSHTFLCLGWLPGDRLLLKRYNLQRDPDECIRRVYDPFIGDQVLYELTERSALSELAASLDDLRELAQGPPDQSE